MNALISACGSAPCAIHIPAAATPSGTPAVYAVTSGTINITSTNISIIGDGVGSTVITYSGSNFLNLAEGDSFVLNPVGKIGGFTLQCTASDSSCIKAGSVIGADFEDIDLYGPGGVASQFPCNGTTGFQFQNSSDGGSWMERWVIRRVQMGGFCTNIHFMNPAGGADSSYGYGLVDGLWTNQSTGSTGVLVDAGAQAYNLLGWTQQVNSGSTSSSDRYFDIAGWFTGSHFGQ